MSSILPKKYFILAVAIILLSTVLLPYLSIRAQPSHVPHENPAIVVDYTDLVSIVVFYGNVFNRAAFREYQDAQSMLDELKYANIPAELSYIIDRHNALIRQLFTTLNDLERQLNEASTLILQNRVDEARQKLDKANVIINNARLMLAEIETVTNALGEKLGALSPAASRRMVEAFNRLLDILARLRQLIDTLNQLRQELLENPQTVITTTSFYYETFLEVSAPQNANPGLPITVSGRVSSTGSAIDRTIRIYLDNTPLAETTTASQFALQITVPPQTATGTHNLTVTALALEHYASASKSSSIDITKLPIIVEAEVPSLNIIPNTIQISGRVRHNLDPLPDAKITATFKSATATVRTSADGSFATAISAPFDLTLFGPQQLTMTVQPTQVWYASTTLNRWILTINPANTGMILIAFISLGLLLFKQVKERRPTPPKEIPTHVVAPPEPPPVTLTLKPDYEIGSPEKKRPPSASTAPNELHNTRGRILSAYNAGLRAIEAATSITIAPHNTLREFAKAVASLVPTAITPLTELTAIAEIALYSIRQIDEEIIARAELLAGNIIRGLHSDIT